MDERRRRELAMELVDAALAAVDPARAVARHLQLEGETLQVGRCAYDLATVDRLVVVGAGKAGAGMAAAVEDILGERITSGWVNVRRGSKLAQPLQRIYIHPAGHPLPDTAGQEGTQHILDLLEGLRERDLVLVLISGGASALLVLPVPGVTMMDLQGLTDTLLRSGATIREINTVRKHLSRVKGGGLARRAGAAAMAVLVLSDVVGNPLDTVGSGPCTPDPTTFADARGILERYNLLGKVPSSVWDHLERGSRGEVEETPKLGDPRFARIHHTIVADNRLAAQAAVERAKGLGWHALLLTTYLEGEAREAGRMLAALAKGDSLPRPSCLVLGGETTVTVRGPGQGGRNQEMALAAALSLAGWEDVMVVTLATDGIDGPTDAAGAVVTGRTVARARVLGLDPAGCLARNDAYPLLQALGGLIHTGPTGTNVNDLAFVLAF